MVVALPELAALAALAACAFLLCLYYAYGYSLGAVLQLLAAMFRNLSINLWLVGRVGFGFVGDAIDGLDHAIRRAIGAGINATLAGWHYMLHVSAYTLERAAGIIEELTGHTWRALEHLRRVTIPSLIHAATHAIWHRIAWLEQQIAELPHRASIVFEQPVKIIRTEIQHVAAAAVAIPLPRIRTLERDYAWLRDKLRSLERGGVVAAVGVVAGVLLAKLGLSWTRCSNVAKVGRHLCGLDRGLLDALLLGSTVIVSSVSLVEFAELLLEVEPELVAGITGGFRELRGTALA